MDLRMLGTIFDRVQKDEIKMTDVEKPSGTPTKGLAGGGGSSSLMMSVAAAEAAGPGRNCSRCPSTYFKTL